MTDVGSRPQLFARELIEGVASHRGDVGLVEFLTGVGRSVSEKIPDEFFTLLAAVAAKVDRPPRVLLLSQEPYVPWELAAVEPALDPHAAGGAPVFLAAQADVGRWVFGQRRPPLPPPVEVDAQTIAVVSGEYPESRVATRRRGGRGGGARAAVPRVAGRTRCRRPSSTASRVSRPRTSCTSRCTERTHPRACSKA